jgi:hypothetical protein
MKVLKSVLLCAYWAGTLAALPLNSNPKNYYSSKSRFFSGRGDVASPIQHSDAIGSAPVNSEDKEQLFEAYNMLHSLAQDFKKPFDSPAVLVVGHQTSGKSALLEALMGFQFNQVQSESLSTRPRYLH